MHISSTRIGVMRFLLPICLLIALVNPIYCRSHCAQANLMPKLCFIHPGKRTDPQLSSKAIDRDQILGGETGLEQGTMQLSNNELSPDISKMEAIIALLMGPTQNEETRMEDIQDEEASSSLSRTQRDKILSKLLLLSRKD